mmetsp:Transcript_13414/g.11909  ORF Transcript_13414/g.11909 Transcript_13414/m.11909 type:complete len:294 (+) Transcript_13414:356-1237(+)
MEIALVNKSELADAEILKLKKFSQIPCSSFLIPKFQTCLDIWQQIESDNMLKKKILDILREIWKFVKNRIPPISLHQDTFRYIKRSQLIKNERIDKLLTARNNSLEKPKAKNSLLIIKNFGKLTQRRTTKSMDKNPNTKFRFKYQREDTQGKLRDFLRGKKDLITLFPNKQVNQSSEYRESYSPVYRPSTNLTNNKHIADFSSNYDNTDKSQALTGWEFNNSKDKTQTNFSITDVAGTLVPDPYLIKRHQGKYSISDPKNIFQIQISSKRQHSRNKLNKTVHGRFGRLNNTIE